MKIIITESQYRVLVEQYDEDYYNQILDLYNESGFEGMTEDEINYLKSGGKSKIPKRFNNSNEDEIETNTEKGVKFIQLPPDDYALTGSLKDLPKIKEIIYDWLDKHCSSLVKFETNSHPFDIFFIDTSVKGKELFFNYNKKRKLLFVYPYVEIGVVNVLLAELPNYSYNRELQLDLIGEWFSDKFNYPIKPYSVYVPFSNITEEIYSIYLMETNSVNLDEIYKFIDEYYNQLTIEVQEIYLGVSDDSISYVYSKSDNETLMIYNNVHNDLGVFDKKLIILIKEKFNYPKKIVESVFKKWYEEKFNQQVNSVRLSKIEK
jgi:hypothetical protein